MRLKTQSYIFITIFCIVSCMTPKLQARTGDTHGFQKPTQLEENTWVHLQQYLLPYNHPIRKSLDIIFSSSRVTENLKTLEMAGFESKKHVHWNNVVVARHKFLTGFLLKLYTDDQVGLDEIPLLTKRIEGANVIREILVRLDLEKFFKAPKKWLYPLPIVEKVDNHDPLYQRKLFILVVEDMEILSTKENKRRWQSGSLSQKKLLYLSVILNEGGLYDSVYIDNIPFSRDSKIAFIDTEHFHIWPVPLHVLTSRLSKKNQIYWQSLY